MNEICESDLASSNNNIVKESLYIHTIFLTVFAVPRHQRYLRVYYGVNVVPWILSTSKNVGVGIENSLANSIKVGSIDRMYWRRAFIFVDSRGHIGTELL